MAPTFYEKCKIANANCEDNFHNTVINHINIITFDTFCPSKFKLHHYGHNIVFVLFLVLNYNILSVIISNDKIVHFPKRKVAIWCFK